MSDLPNYDPAKLVSVSELASIYGRTKRSIQLWINAGRFPNAQKIGNMFVVPWSDILADLEQNEQEN